MERVFQYIFLAWGTGEVLMVIVRRARGVKAERRDRGSLLLVVAAITAGILAAQRLRDGAVAPIVLATQSRLNIALAFLVAGMIMRWWSILTLGRYFTVDVAIQHSHEVVQGGPYRWLRHPSYTGALIAFAGVGLAFGDWLAMIALLVPVIAAIMYRVRVEERTLVGALGANYAEYSARTKRLIPGIY
jgi:protein-S-isoprenylcysteine O-methyltransferase